MGGSDFLEKVKSIVVKVTQFIQFRLVIPRHDVGSKSYKGKVDRFRAGMADVGQLLDLGCIGPLSRVGTTVPSGAQTPASRPARAVTVKKKIGEGAFRIVYRVWNVNTGEEYALKNRRTGMTGQTGRERSLL